MRLIFFFTFIEALFISINKLVITISFLSLRDFAIKIISWLFDNFPFMYQFGLSVGIASTCIGCLNQKLK